MAVGEISRSARRLEALSDGIFAIAMTLLVLEIRVPAADRPDELLSKLGELWPSYFAFVIGFFTLLVCWINHHWMFDHIRRADGGLMLVNGLKLLVVSFTPFATALLADKIGTESEQIAVSVYTGTFFLMGLSMTGIWCYAQSRGYTRATSPSTLAAATRYYIFAPILSGVIFLLSFVSVWASLAVFVLMFVIYVFPSSAIRII